MKDNTHVKPSTLNPTMDDKSTTRTSPSTDILIISVTVPAIVLLVIIAIVVFVKKKGLSTRPLTLTNANAQHELTVSPIANEPMKEVHA